MVLAAHCWPWGILSSWLASGDPGVQRAQVIWREWSLWSRSSPRFHTLPVRLRVVPLSKAIHTALPFPTMIKSSGVGGPSQETQGNTMATDAWAHCITNITRVSAAMILVMQNKRVLVIDWEEFQLFHRLRIATVEHCKYLNYLSNSTC